MALMDEMFKGNVATGLVVGLGTAFLGPAILQTMGSVLRTAAKSVIKGGLVFYQETLSEIGEMAGDLVAEAKAELEQDGEAHRDAKAAGAATGPQAHAATV
jgi:hypothetical protein